MRDRLLSVDEAAARIHRDPSLIRRVIREGRLSATRIGHRAYAIAESDLDKFAAIDRPRGRPPHSSGPPR